TAQYLYHCLKDRVKKDFGLDIALVAGSATQTTFGKNEFSNVLTNFSPISKSRELMKSMPKEGAIDILIATDCIGSIPNLL
ncbi:MAG TPA: hypothetical protein VJ440_12465, partial [Candidatus Brocadiaceae bacterium]|nr:hypothetical protein [Candidatus Brocadiaceae bacterium]